MPRPSLNLISAIVAAAALPATAFAAVAPPPIVDRTFVSATGTDAGACPFAAPCATLPYAYAHTQVGGEIVVLSPANYNGGSGQVDISKSITIRGNGGHMSLTAFLNIGGPSTNRIVLEDLDFAGTFNNAGSPGQQAYAIFDNGAGDVAVTDCTFRNFATAAISISPSSGSSRVTVRNSSFVNNASVAVLVQGSGTGIGHAKIFDSLIAGNPTAGVQVVGSGDDVVLRNVTILGSAKALDLQSGGAATSYGGNVITNGDSPVQMPTQ